MTTFVSARNEETSDSKSSPQADHLFSDRIELAQDSVKGGIKKGKIVMLTKSVLSIRIYQFTAST